MSATIAYSITREQGYLGVKSILGPSVYSLLLLSRPAIISQVKVLSNVDNHSIQDWHGQYSEAG